MLLDINKIGDRGLSFAESLRLDGVARDCPDVADVPTVTLAGTVQPGPDLRNPAEGALLEARLCGTLRLRCSRCLETLEAACRSSVRFVLVAELPETDAADAEEEQARTQFFELADGKLPLDELAAEQVYLEMPLKPLCREDCAGLCPTCGNNRNRLECACRQEDVDPRLAALKDIRDRMGES